MSMITVPRVGGLALIIGSLLYIVATLIAPGYVIGASDVRDVYGLVEAIAENSLFSAFAAFLGGTALVFLLWGLTVMWQTAQNECALDTFVKFGLVGVILSVIILMCAQSADFVTSLVVEHGMGRGAGPAQADFLQNAGIQIQLFGGVARSLASITGLMGYIVLGFALARKFRPGTYRILAFIVGIGAIVSLIGMILTEPMYDLIDTLGPIFTVLSMFYLVWWIIIGIGVYQERFGLRIGQTPEH